MKQTAVEWLVLHLNKQEWFTHKQKQTIEQAKAMEKEQIIQFATEYSNHILNDGLLTPTEFFKQNFKLK